jgi:uncharacterized protein (TIGR01244 family)
MKKWLMSLSAVSVVLATVAVLAFAQPGQAGREAPFGDRVSARLYNYNRPTPFMGTGGAPAPGGVAELASLGFKLIIDLRGPGEDGVAREVGEVKKAGLRYVNIPVTTLMPTPDQVARFAALIEQSDNWPVFVHCGSAARVGGIWALYRAGKGVPATVALEEGRGIGLRGRREAAVRAALGLE